ncbi:hypothetical protein JVX92_00570 [Microbacterium hominis]|uniref:hypothetical protein n=1 Tax=Microbacterium hominis TaxID=162426 RepID=UPI0019638D1C|nr:hypothetical protein [Microbacterium hominis]QRY40822.1 hypothetical protein JVX92_00570 [Microbacterium hominis]
MTHISSELEAVDDGISEHRWATRRNRANQSQLLRRIAFANDDERITPDVVAARLGISADELESILSGSRELSFTEFRMLVSACELVVDYIVEPARQDRKRHLLYALTQRSGEAREDREWGADHYPILSEVKLWRTS